MGFKVTRDFTNDKEDSIVGYVSEVPRNPLHMYMGVNEENYIYKEGKIKVRLVDDDGGICFHGLVDDFNFSAEFFLDWGMRYAGATTLDLSMDDWKIWGEGMEHPYPSKDGKWVSFMK